MRRSVVAAVLVALIGLGCAFAFPSSRVADCPPTSSGVACVMNVDVHPWIRVGIGLAALVPAISLIGSRFIGNRWVAAALLVTGFACATLLWSVSGLVPARGGDCPPYPRCFTPGHPYGGAAVVVLIFALFFAAWLWNPHVDIDPPPVPRQWRPW
jgi:hypothetical protein